MLRPAEERIVHVPLGERAYDILIGPGLIGRAGGEFTARLKGRRAAIITDENVASHYLAPLMDSLQTDGIEAVSLTLPAGEKTKSFDNLAAVADMVLSAKIERNDAVIALGGGVIGDLAGFAAGIVRRGVRFVQIPTSLLAQVDSSVGGKTGMARTFWAPSTSPTWCLPTQPFSIACRRGNFGPAMPRS
jgi:3-dehydroquinate synthase